MTADKIKHSKPAVIASDRFAIRKFQLEAQKVSISDILLAARLDDRGYVLLMTSSDLEEVVGISDVVVTLYRGKIVSTYQHSRIDMAHILADITHPIGAKAA